jgi:hypothetical protein
MKRCTPPLPVAAVPQPCLPLDKDLSATEAQRVLLYCALDAVGVPRHLCDAAAVTRIAELDYRSVDFVITWLRTATRGGAW